MSGAPTVFLLSPASCAGRRAQILFEGSGTFALAERLRSGQAVAVAEVFSFLSGLYFRGKYAYAQAFARPPRGVDAAYVITTNRGLVPAETRLTLDELRTFGTVPIAIDEPRYREPLLRDARALADRMPEDAHVVLLGSIASGKYVDLLRDVFGDALLFPREFVGRGDMSRGGLLLRCVDDGQELEYVRIDDVPRRGPRPPRLEPRPRRESPC